jgi:CHAT domain-containing protein
MSTAVASKRDQRLVEQLRSISTQAERAEFLERYPSLLKPDVVAELAQAVLEHVRINAAEALALAEGAIAISEKLEDQHALGLALRSKANAFYILGRHKAAYELHDQALALFDALGDASEAGRTLSASLQPLLLCGEYERAFAASDRARAIFQAEGNELRLARLDINTGNIYYRQDRFAEALECYQRAYRVVLEKGNSEGIGVVLGNLATCFISLGDFPQAMQTNQHAREYCDQHGMPLLRAQADYNIAYLYYLRGEYSRAIEMLRSTRLACKEVGDQYHYGLCNLDLSELYLELNLSTEAADLGKQAREEFEKLEMGYEAAKAMAFEAIALSQHGQAFHGMKLFTEARALFVKEKNQVWPSLIDLYQALVLFNEGRHFEARRLAKAALDFFDSSLLPGKAVLCRLLLARVAQRTNDLAGARQQCADAIEKLGSLQAPALKQQAFLLMGQIHAASGKQQEAYQCFRTSREALEGLRGNLHGEELKLSFLKNKLEVYELLVDASLQQSVAAGASLEEAFGYIEEAKSRTLMDQMLQPVATPADISGQSDLVRRMRGLRDELNWYYSLIELEQLRPETRSADHIKQLESQARARETDLIRVLQEASVSEATQAGVAGSEKVSLEQIRETIGSDTVVLEFFQTGDRILACLLGGGRLEILPVTLASRIASTLRLLQFQLSKFRLGTEYALEFQHTLLESTKAHLRSLYDELIAPVRDRLKPQHLLIVPHGVLHYVPFHALFDGERYLIDDHTVSYAPSASTFALCATKRVNADGPALLMGVPDEKAPSIGEELRALTRMLPDAATYVGAAASEYVLKTVGAQSRLVHIATHGYFRQDSPMFSSIRLGNSYLSLYDLYQLRLPADLITLSGCATGLNVVVAGDELIGLARGLFQAGARSLLLSLWDVHDQSTAEFMKRFYSRFQDGAGKAAAVRQAMLEIREIYPHPYQWAPFVLMGKYD